MAFPWMAVAGLAGSLISGGKEAKAINREADIQWALAQPGLKAQQFALPQLQSTIMSQLAPKLGKASPLLSAGHTLNLANINKNAQKQSLLTGYQSAKLGMRGRGAQLASDWDKTNALNQENLGYATQQQQYKDTNTNNFLSALSNLAGLGGQGLNTAVGASNLRAQGASDRWGDMGSLFGTLAAMDPFFNKKKKDQV